MAAALWTIEEYTTPQGATPVVRFLISLTGRDKAEAIALIQQVQQRGNTLRLPHSKALGEGLFELRGKQVRLFYVFRSGHRVMLLDGTVKQGDAIPASVLDRVRAMQQAVEQQDRKAAKQ